MVTEWSIELVARRAAIEFYNELQSKVSENLYNWVTFWNDIEDHQAAKLVETFERDDKEEPSKSGSNVLLKIAEGAAWAVADIFDMTTLAGERVRDTYEGAGQAAVQFAGFNYTDIETRFGLAGDGRVDCWLTAKLCLEYILHWGDGFVKHIYICGGQMRNLKSQYWFRVDIATGKCEACAVSNRHNDLVQVFDSNPEYYGQEYGYTINVASGWHDAVDGIAACIKKMMKAK